MAMAITDATFITRSLTGRAFSTIVTALTVAIAVALMLVLLGMRDAGREAFARGTGNMHLLISREDSALVSILNNVYYAGAPRRAIDHATVERLEGSHPWAWFIPTQIGDSYRGRPVVATTRSFFTDFEPAPGDPWAFERGGLFESAFEVVVGSAAAGATGLRVGDEISLTHGAPGPGGELPVGVHTHEEYQFTVVGVLEPTGSAHDRALFAPLEGSWVLHAHDRRLAELGPDAGRTTVDDLTDADRQVTAIYTRLITRPSREVPANLQQVFSQLRADPSLTVAQPNQEIRRLFRIVGNIDQIIIGLAAVVLVSSGIGILLALYNTMEQRRRQIALLRVLGASRGKVFGLVITESTVLGLIGAAAGVLLSLVGARIVAAALYERLGLVIEPGVDPRIVMLVVVGTLALAAAAGLVPAVSAYRTNVVRNLRPLG